MIVRRFLRDTRAGATAIVAVAVSVMTIGGVALVSDHAWLVGQRDGLKSATDAATIAATQELTKLSTDDSVSDADIKEALESVARRYILLNLGYLSTERFERARDSLTVEVTSFDRNLNTVVIAVSADVGEALVAGMLPLFGANVEVVTVHVDAGVESVPNPVEVALALDISHSMMNCLDGRNCKVRNKDQNRLSLVKQAAGHLVDILDPDANGRVAVGVVPWHTEVRLDADARAKWEANGWAKYPLSRHYGTTYICKGGELACTPPEVEHTLPPSAPEAWRGCLDEQRVSQIGRHAKLPAPDGYLDPPSTLDRAFAQTFYISSYGFSYECLAGTLPADFNRQICFDSVKQPGFIQYLAAPQYRCKDEVPSILPLTSNRTQIDTAIGDLEAIGERTYSSLGILWAQRLLSHPWQGVWGNPHHPVDPAADENTRKAIVLLTDGEDTHCGIGNTSCANSPVGIARADACAKAKAAGSEIFVVAAMAPTFVSTAFETDLRNCSSESDNPDGTYVFVNNSTPEELKAAFAEIARQLMVVRRTR